MANAMAQGQPPGLAAAVIVGPASRRRLQRGRRRLGGHVVRMANSHPAVLAMVDEVIGANDEDGVATVIEHLFG